MQRFKFYNRTHVKGETITAYVAVLRTLSEYCDFGDSLSTMLRDRFVYGINHEGIQRRLLAEKDVTYKKVHELAVILEAAAKTSAPPPFSKGVSIHWTGMAYFWFLHILWLKFIESRKPKVLSPLLNAEYEQ